MTSQKLPVWHFLACFAASAIVLADARAQNHVVGPGGKADNSNNQQQQQQKQQSSRPEPPKQQPVQRQPPASPPQQAQHQRQPQQPQNQQPSGQQRPNQQQQNQQQQQQQLQNQPGQPGVGPSGGPNMPSQPNRNDPRWAKPKAEPPKFRVVGPPPRGNSSNSTSPAQPQPADPRSLDDQRQDAQIEDLRRQHEMDEMIRERMIWDQRRRQAAAILNPDQRILGGFPLAGPGPAAPAARGAARNRPSRPGKAPPAVGSFAVQISRLQVTRETADDPPDGPGDEVFVSCAVGEYDAIQNSLMLGPPAKTNTIRGLRSNKLARADADAGLTLTLRSNVELAEGENLLVIIPTIWEEDGRGTEEGSVTDRAGRLYDLIALFESEIGRRLGELPAGERFGVKHGKNLGLPFVSGTSGGNRPIGMRPGPKENEFYPEVLLLSVKEAEKRAEHGGDPIHYFDDPATKLGGDYRLHIKVTRLE